MSFPKTSYVVTADIWFDHADGARKPSRGIYSVWAESVTDALDQHKADIEKSATAYTLEDVQIISVMQQADADMLTYGERKDLEARNARAGF